MKKKFLLQLTILAALKLTRAKAQNIIFPCLVTLSISGAAWWHVRRQDFKQAELSVVTAHAIPRQLYATYMLRAALKFVALIVKIF
jgi:hypothetical protein